MYSFSKRDWEYIVKYIDFLEAYNPKSESRLITRKKYLEKLGYEVIPYEDKGVSIGIYVMRKGKNDNRK